MTARPLAYSDGNQALTGHFAPAAGGGRSPGVLVVHAWLGVTDSIRRRADRLAEAGYSALACDIFGAPVDISQGPRATVGPYIQDPALFRRRLRAGLDALVAQPEVDADAVVAMGYCFGGTGALELARDGAALRGVISFHGALATRHPAAPGLAPKLLVLTGDEDPLVPFEQVAAFRDEMRTAGANFEIAIYSGAKHSFTGEGALSPERTPEAIFDPQAEARSWRAMLGFLAEVTS